MVALKNKVIFSIFKKNKNKIKSPADDNILCRILSIHSLFIHQHFAPTIKSAMPKAVTTTTANTCIKAAQKNLHNAKFHSQFIFRKVFFHKKKHCRIFLPSIQKNNNYKQQNGFVIAAFMFLLLLLFNFSF